MADFRFQPDVAVIEAFQADGASREQLLDAYQSIVLPLVLQDSGWEALHASAVVMPVGVVAFPALSGVGKTTTALGLARRGFKLGGRRCGHRTS